MGQVPFIRPKRISGDVPTEDVTVHAVNFLRKKLNLMLYLL